MEFRRPNAFKSQTTTRIITSAFKIDLIDAAIGMKVFTIQRRTPTTIKVRSTGSKGILTSWLTPELSRGQDLRGCSTLNMRLKSPASFPVLRIDLCEFCAKE